MTGIKYVVPFILMGCCASLTAMAQTSDEIAKAVLPLPEELRATATVFTYDKTTGERIVLRQGTSHVECEPRDEETGFTRCMGTADADRRDLSAKLTAQGVSEDDLPALMQAAEDRGEIKPRVFGSMMYRLYDKADRIQLLWVISVPNATPESLGMPVESQRDNALAGRGTPWMMLPGTPGAHLMIPINGTELSNKP